MGLLHVLLARRLGAWPVLVSEPDEERAAIARRFGATTVINPRESDLAATVSERTAGQGADAAVITSGVGEVLPATLAAVRRQGVVSLFAGFPPDTSVPLDPNGVHYSEVRLTGSQNATPDQYRRVLQLLPHMNEIDGITTHRVPLADATQAYEVRLRNEGLKSTVLVSG
jgi:L-iditol 2-dehydrogenase